MPDEVLDSSREVLGELLRKASSQAPDLAIQSLNKFLSLVAVKYGMECWKQISSKFSHEQKPVDKKQIGLLEAVSEVYNQSHLNRPHRISPPYLETEEKDGKIFAKRIISQRDFNTIFTECGIGERKFELEVMNALEILMNYFSERHLDRSWNSMLKKDIGDVPCMLIGHFAWLFCYQIRYMTGDHEEIEIIKAEISFLDKIINLCVKEEYKWVMGHNKQVVFERILNVMINCQEKLEAFNIEKSAKEKIGLCYRDLITTVGMINNVLFGFINNDQYVKFGYTTDSIYHGLVRFGGNSKHLFDKIYEPINLDEKYNPFASIIIQIARACHDIQKEGISCVKFILPESTDELVELMLNRLGIMDKNFMSYPDFQNLKVRPAPYLLITERTEDRSKLKEKIGFLVRLVNFAELFLNAANILQSAEKLAASFGDYWVFDSEDAINFNKFLQSLAVEVKIFREFLEKINNEYIQACRVLENSTLLSIKMGRILSYIRTTVDNIEEIIKLLQGDHARKDEIENKNSEARQAFYSNILFFQKNYGLDLEIKVIPSSKLISKKSQRFFQRKNNNDELDEYLEKNMQLDYLRITAVNFSGITRNELAKYIKKNHSEQIVARDRSGKEKESGGIEQEHQEGILKQSFEIDSRIYDNDLELCNIDLKIADSISNARDCLKKSKEKIYFLECKRLNLIADIQNSLDKYIAAVEKRRYFLFFKRAGFWKHCCALELKSILNAVENADEKPEKRLRCAFEFIENDHRVKKYKNQDATKYQFAALISRILSSNQLVEAEIDSLNYQNQILAAQDKFRLAQQELVTVLSIKEKLVKDFEILAEEFANLLPHGIQNSAKKISSSSNTPAVNCDTKQQTAMPKCKAR